MNSIHSLSGHLPGHLTAYMPATSGEAAEVDAARFSKAMAAAESPKSWLTSAQASDASRPSVKAFMDRAGVGFLDASEMIYGVVGSNTDVRDWASIMASPDPVSAARQATGQMYGRTDGPVRSDAHYISPQDTVARAGHFAVREVKAEGAQVAYQGVDLIDAQGLLLRGAGSTPEAIARNAWLFGFDTQPLAGLVDAAQSLSADLGKAVQMASTRPPADPRQVVATDILAIPQVLADVFSLPQKGVEVATEEVAQEVAHAVAHEAAPALKEAIQEATTQAFSHVDSQSYLQSLFKA